MRVIIIFTFLTILLGAVPIAIYSSIGIDTDHFGWGVTLGVFIIVFILYRNRLQFSGWYKGKGREKLPGSVSTRLVITAILLVLSPLILNLALG